MQDLEEKTSRGLNTLKDEQIVVVLMDAGNVKSL